MKANSPDAGYSFIDLIIVLLVVGILVTIAIPQLNKTNSALIRQNIAREFKTYLDRARFDSIKRHAQSSNQMAGVTINNANSFSLLSDFNSDGMLQPGEIRNFIFGEKDGIQIIDKDLVFPVRIAFNYRGQVSVFDGNNKEITPNFTFCEKNCSSQNPNSTNSTTILISKAGNSIVYNGSSL